MQNPLPRLSIIVVACLLFLTLQVACGYFQKDKKKTSVSTSDLRFPGDWDLLGDWTGGDWKVEDL